MGQRRQFWGVYNVPNLIPRAFWLLTAHARRKRMALERTGSKSSQIADLLYCITFQRTNQDCLRIGPFQSPSFSSSMRSKKLEGSEYEIAMCHEYHLPEIHVLKSLGCWQLPTINTSTVFCLKILFQRFLGCSVYFELLSFIQKGHPHPNFPPDSAPHPHRIQTFGSWSPEKQSRLGPHLLC